MAPKKKQAVIRNKAFAGTAELTANDYKRLVVENFAEAANTLVEEYSGYPIAIPVVSLSQDNTRIENATLVMCGTHFDQTGKVIQANRLWPIKEPVKLHIHPIQLEKFQFQGGMVSELLDSTEIEFTLVPEKEDSTITDEILAEQGITGFTLRMFVTPINGYTARATTMIYPLQVEELLDEYPSATCPQFPGICLDRCEVELGVRASHVLDKCYGQPIAPAIVVQSPLRTSTNTPSSGELSATLSGLLHRVVVPESKTAIKGLRDRWQAISENGDEQLRVILPDTLWPEKEAPSTSQGKKFIMNLIM